jgi:starch synthase
MSVSILMVGSEAVPFSKTGGLADVLGALPLALGRLGHRVTLVTPRYRGIQARGAMRTIAVPLGGETFQTRLLEQPLANGVKAVLVDRPELYDRDSIYGTPADYPDSPRRFAFLCKAALEYVLQSGYPFDLLHAHDWQGGLAPVYLRTLYAQEPRLKSMGSIFTIHNIAYQGIFSHDWLAPLDLRPDLISMNGLEFWGQLSLLKGGILFSRVVTTVSPTYAHEIQTKEYGAGFEGIVSMRKADLHGVLNGVDTDSWDPRRDPFLPEPYDETMLEKKGLAKRALFEVFGNPAGAASPRPLIGIVSRLVDQKGFDLIEQIGGELPDFDAGFAVLGTGTGKYERMWQKLAATYPDKFAVKIGFDEGLAHLIEGASDIFLMPSRFEPCGLNQLYSLRYGTLPIVRATGGLADTVADAGEMGQGTGFSFSQYTPGALVAAVRRALAAYRHPETWQQMQRRGMKQDHSWDASAREYVKVYRALTAGATAATP